MIFAICYFRLCKNDALKTFCQQRDRMLQEIVNKNILKIVTLPNNLVLTCRFYDHNLVFCSLSMIREICLFC